ncbi:hypothetical protein [Pseudomonas sp. PONIH3]|jgi:hypothetical protein|uniref:hypothetical protein n=1 Tax=Pseudomonas sp. PONIH3 TaxID=1636610 RepID=UPI000CDBAC6F|nr:hypothetical protein [Pseudomonas sp. PONIH3]AUY32660.1 hypothetical protein C3F42_05230 [Pseudomonas sp. PONIH3]
MAMDQAERDRRRREKSAKHQEEDLRLKVRPGTKQALLELMEWSGIEEQGEAMTLMIHRLHELTRDEAVKLLKPPRHTIELSHSVARKLDRFRISRELRTSGLMLGDDPDDSGIYVIDQLSSA